MSQRGLILFGVAAHEDSVEGVNHILKEAGMPLSMRKDARFRGARIISFMARTDTAGVVRLTRALTGLERVRVTSTVLV